MANPNVLLVVLDSVRARNMSLYGYGNETTPYLEDFAEDANVYKQARAPSIHSVSSHASIFTGYHVPEHGITAHEAELDPESTIWHTLSNEYGYTTGLFSPNVIVTVTSNLSEPFETVNGPMGDVSNRAFEGILSPSDVEGHQTKIEYLQRCVKSGTPIRAAINGLYFEYGDHGGKRGDERAPVYIDSFLDWSETMDRPWAACLNLMDAHYPYDPDPDHDRWGGAELQAIHDELSTPPSKEIVTNDDWWKLRAIESLYDGTIHQLDTALRHLIEKLRDRDVLEDTLLVITSDHGEGFGEWSRVAPTVRIADHGWGIHESLTHVPLIVRTPDGEDRRQETNLASLTQFPSVVLEAINGEDPSFEVDDYALASTYRLEDPTKVLPSTVSDRTKYAGPWRAVYEQTADTVKKHVTGGGNGALLSIPDTRTTAHLQWTTGEFVTETYDGLVDANVKKEEMDTKQSLDDNIEQQLEGLGYLR